MKIWIPNELVFTVFFGKGDASERMRDIFEEEYGEIGKAFTSNKPKIAYDEVQDNYKNTITWN